LVLDPTPLKNSRPPPQNIRPPPQVFRPPLI
jgi:hypothetical protein